MKMKRMFGKKRSPPCGHCGAKAQLAGKGNIAGPSRAVIAEGVGEMIDGLADLRFKPMPPFEYFVMGLLVIQRAQRKMMNSVRA